MKQRGKTRTERIFSRIQRLTREADQWEQVSGSAPVEGAGLALPGARDEAGPTPEHSQVSCFVDRWEQLPSPRHQDRRRREWLLLSRPSTAARLLARLEWQLTSASWREPWPTLLDSFEHVVLCCDPRQDAEDQLQQLLWLTQQAGDGLHLSIVTQGAQPIGPHDPIHPSAQAIWGMARVLRVERPGWQIRLLDLPYNATDTSLQSLPAAFEAPHGELELALRRGVLWVPRLQRQQVLEAPASSEAASPPGVSGRWLVTGGMGELGQEWARALVEAGAVEVLLATHQGSALPAELLDLCRQRGASCRSLDLDLCDGDAVEACVQGLAPLKGLIHCADAPREGLLDGLDEEGLLQPFHRRARGARHLHRATLRQPLERFISCSTWASVWGAAGQSGEAAAGGYLHGLALMRRAQGLPAHSIAWGDGDRAANRQATEHPRGAFALPPAQTRPLLASLLRTPNAPAHIALGRPLAPWLHPALCGPRFCALARP